MKTKRTIFKRIICLMALTAMVAGSTLTASAEEGVTVYWKADGTYTFVSDSAVPAVGTNGLPLYHKEYSKSVVEVSSVTPGGIYVYGVWDDIYTPEQVALLYSIIDASGITNEMSKYDKAVLLNNAECAVLYYKDGQKSMFGDGLYCVQMGGGATCQGYTDLYQTLCQAVGIDCQVIYGASERNVGHAWNLLSINGKEYYNDVTNNDAHGNAYLMWETPFPHREIARSTNPEQMALINPYPMELRMLDVRNYGPEDAASININTMAIG